jgi:chromosome segregation protein
MYLKKLELNGFKSFADKTALEILPGVTSIVGPNGCGKTNIVDAISWVLGEQRIRMLRGYKMEDIIFNGTSGRQPIGMAEVTLTFDNSDGGLPIEYSEVSITRRIYRSGESGYYINKKACRLKDINELLLGTGLGHRSYSLVGQGRIDQILQSKPEERRKLLEEAAQISRYRQKKEEALRKLERTRSNLLRVDDILKEVKRQLSIADRQARKAEKYRQYRDRLRELETASGRLELEANRKRAGNLNLEKEQWLEKCRVLETELEEVEKNLTELRQRRRERVDRLADKKGELIGIRAEIDKSRHRIELNAERGGELKRERAQLDEEITNITGSLSSGKKEAEQLKETRNGLIEVNQKRDELLKGKEEELQVFRNERSAVERELSSLQSQSLESSRREGHIRNELSGLRAGGKELLLRKRKLEVELEGISEEEVELQEELEEAGPLGSETEEKLDSLKKKLDEERGLTREREEEAMVIRSRKEKLLVSISERESQKELLKNWDEDRPRTAVDILMTGMREGEFSLPGVIGSLEEYIKIKSGSEKLVRAVLGEKMRALLVRSLPDAMDVIDCLKDKNAGSIRLIIVDWLKETSLNNHSAGQDLLGRNGISGQVSFLSPIEGMGSALLGDAVSVSDLSRFSAAAGDRPIVTAEGIKASPPGVIFWVGDAQLDSQLNLRDIETELASLRVEESEIKSIEDENNTHLINGRKKIEELVRELHRQEMDLTLSRNEQDRSRNALGKLRLSRDAIGNELEAMEEENRRTTGRLKQLELSLAECPSDDQIKEKELNSLRERLSERVHSLRQLETEVTDLKIALASSREREDGLTNRLERLLSENNNQAILLESRRRRIVEDEDREKALREETVRLRDDIAGWESTVNELRLKVSGMEAEIETLSKECEEKEGVFRDIRPRVQEAQSRMGSQDVILAELRVKEQTLRQRMREKYEIELDDLEVPQDAYDPEAMAEEIEILRDKMGRMTDVNLAALADKENYESRFTMLTEQKADLEAAARDIEEAINRINVTAREKLQTTYDIVRKHFQDLFRHLFGGGKADLILDIEKDILESGLDIIAQPPGKKLSHISLLSGGERALTTIALIFALFKVQPSPFYILDEIDAPLDEANIGRFVTLLKTLASESQFIIITHNKLSISEADILYGITMEESGVSKVVSVRLAGTDPKKPKQLPVPEPAEIAETSDQSESSDLSDSSDQSETAKKTT